MGHKVGEIVWYYFYSYFNLFLNHKQMFIKQKDYFWYFIKYEIPNFNKCKILKFNKYKTPNFIIQFCNNNGNSYFNFLNF